jgi:hypothetical protein
VSRSNGSCANARAAGGAGAGRRRAGFSYVEVLVATALLALVLVPALEALEVGIRGGGVHEIEVTRHYHLLAKMEEVLAESFFALEAEALAAGTNPSAYSDAPGSPERRLVYLSGYDADGVGGDDPGILQVRAEIEETQHVLETLTTP